MRFLFILSTFLIHLSLSSQNLDTSQIEKQVNSLMDSSKFYLQIQDNDRAFKFQREAHQLVLNKLGVNSPMLINCLQHLGNLYFTTHDFENAERSFKDALELCQRLKGTDHTKCMSIHGNLAYLYTTIGKLDLAESMHMEKKLFHERKGDSLSMPYSSTLNNLAINYYFSGKYEKAEELYLKTISIREKIFGKNNPEYCGALVNLGSLYSEMGLNELAEPLWLEAKKIFEDSLKNLNHPFYFNCLANLSAFYFLIGYYEKAETGYRQQLFHYEKNDDTLNPAYSNSLVNIAEIYKLNKQFDLAESTWLKSLRIMEKLYGAESEDYAIVLTKLGSMHLDNNNPNLAEDLFLQADKILRKLVNSNPTSLMANLSFLADLYYYKNDYAKSEMVLNEYKDLCIKYLGKNNDYYANILQSLGIHYSNLMQGEKAGPYFKESAEVDRQIILKSLHRLSERELQKYLGLFATKQDKLLSFAFKTTSPLTEQVLFDNCLFYKGFLQYAISHSKRLALNNPLTEEKYQELKVIERLLINHYSAPINEQDPNVIHELENQKTNLEKDLASKIKGYENAHRQVTWQEVQTTLKPHEAVIEFIRFENFGRELKDSILYAALLLKQGMSSPKAILLFDEHALDFIMLRNEGRKADYVNKLYTLADRGAQAVELPNKSLFELIWKPLQNDLSGIQTIYYSPSGLLHRINLAAIPINEGENLADRYKFIGMNSTRQLLIPDDEKINKQDALLIGGLKFERDSADLGNKQLLANRSLETWTLSNSDSRQRGGNWGYLPGTENEIKAIHQLMKFAGVETTVKNGNDGTESYFKSIGIKKPSPRVLHIATHGYFFPDIKHESSMFKSAVTTQEPVFKMSEHPMLRSGLILSGGNAGWRGERSLVDGEDGVLTAYEISQMNLSNTELVILSACETGLGDIQGNEGVYGLQRAFKIAGVKYIIMSLWQVPDKQTSLLMTTFYKKWLEAEGPDKGGNKLSIPDAFHAAQKELRDIGLDPYQWAGFVLVE